MKYSYKLPPLLETLREIFIPDVAQSLASLAAALLVYGVSSANYYWDRLTGGDIVSKKYTADSFSAVTASLSHFPGASSVGIVVIWGVAGIALYLLMLQVINFAISTRNNSLLNGNLHGESKLLAFSLLNEYRRVLWVTLFCIILWASAALLPFWVGCFQIFNELGHEPKFIVLGILGSAVNLYLLFSAASTVRHNPKINL
jgi:hypothetical protein